MSFAEVVFPIPLKKVFSYQVPGALEGLLKPGMRCSVSFGRRHTVGMVSGLTAHSPAQFKDLKPIEELLDTEPSLTPDLLELGKWISDYYYCSLGEALFAMLPTGYRKNPKAFLGLTEAGESHPEKVEELLERIGALRGVNLKSLKAGKVPLTARTRELAQALKKESLGLLNLEGTPSGSKGKKPERERLYSRPPALHPQQAAALSAITEALALHAFQTFLLQGVTGS